MTHDESSCCVAVFDMSMCWWMMCGGVMACRVGGRLLMSRESLESLNHAVLLCRLISHESLESLSHAVLLCSICR